MPKQKNLVKYIVIGLGIVILAALGTYLVCKKFIVTPQPTTASVAVPTTEFIERGGFTLKASASQDSGESFRRGTDIALESSGQSLKVGSSVDIFLRGEYTIKLGQALVGADGSISTNLTIPADTLAPRYYTVHMYATTPNESLIDFYQSIFVYAEEDDIDGDGKSNSSEPCGGFVEPANVDEDKDGVDDACDGFVGASE